VTVEINGKLCQVPEATTVIQALWYTGHELIRGIGCLGGVCGACTFTYRKKGDPGIRSGLACQTLVEPDMVFTVPSSITISRAKYHIQEIEDPQADLIKYYPETRRCTRCNACTLVCPQEIDVRACVVKALSGEFAAVSDLFYHCVMCGLCAAVCDVSIKPNLVALYVRRTQGAHLSPRPHHLTMRIQELQCKVHIPLLQKVLTMSENELRNFNPQH